ARLAHLEAREPAKQQVVIQLLRQQALAPNGIGSATTGRAAVAPAGSRAGRSWHRAHRTRTTCRATPRRPRSGSRATGGPPVLASRRTHSSTSRQAGGRLLACASS